MRYRIALDIVVEDKDGQQLKLFALFRRMLARFLMENKLGKGEIRVYEVEQLDYPEVDIEKICP